MEKEVCAWGGRTNYLQNTISTKVYILHFILRNQKQDTKKKKQEKQVVWCYWHSWEESNMHLF